MLNIQFVSQKANQMPVKQATLALERCNSGMSQQVAELKFPFCLGCTGVVHGFRVARRTARFIFLGPSPEPDLETE